MYYLGIHTQLVKQFKKHMKTVNIELKIVDICWWGQERAQKVQKSSW